MLVLHTYFCSSASYRVRIALEFKGLSCEAVPVHLVRGGGEQHSAALAALTPAELVPVRVDGEVTQSLPIIEYLDEIHPAPAFLPADAAGRARVRATGRYCLRDTPTLADCCLVPQIYNAERFGVAQTAYPIIRRIGQAGLELSTFQHVAPEAQADAA